MSAFNRLPLVWKVSIPVAIIFFFSIGIALFSLSSLYSSMFKERENSVHGLSETAVGVARAFYSLAEKGEMTQEEAQERAKQSIGNMRYGNNNYIYVFDHEGNTLVHGTASLVGKNLWDLQDPNGVYVVRELVRLGKEGGGLLSYMWPRADSEDPIEKAGWGEPFEPWGWVLGTGVYMDDLNDAFRKQAILLLGITLIGALIALIISYVIIRSISSAVGSLTESMDTLASGNSDVKIEGVDRGDEIGRMASAMEVFVGNENRRKTLESEQQAQQEKLALRGIEMQEISAEFDQQITNMMQVIEASVQKLQVASAEMASGAAQTTQESGRVTSASEAAAGNVETVAAAAEELSASITEIRRQAKNSSDIASQAAKEAETTNERMTGLNEASGRIGEVVTLIQAIAEQTNLLALNATIEAARAGEAGKGFAVVAAEVKELASQTSKATEEISSQIAAIQAETTQAVEAISSVTEVIDKMNEISASISASVEEQGTATVEIASNAAQASKSTIEVSSSISGVSDAAENTRVTAESVDSSARQLEENAAQLRAHVAEFLGKVRSNEAA